MAGHLSAGISPLSDLVKPHEAGKLRVLSTSGVARSPSAPDVPTFTELGFPDIAGNY